MQSKNQKVNFNHRITNLTKVENWNVVPSSPTSIIPKEKHSIHNIYSVNKCIEPSTVLKQTESNNSKNKQLNRNFKDRNFIQNNSLMNNIDNSIKNFSNNVYNFDNGSKEIIEVNNANNN